MPTKEILDSLHKVFFDTQKRKPESGKELSRYEELLNEAQALIQTYKDEAKKAELDAIREKIKELGISAAELGFNIPVEGSGSRSAAGKGKADSAPAEKINIRYVTAAGEVAEASISGRGRIADEEVSAFVTYCKDTKGIKRADLALEVMDLEAFKETFKEFIEQAKAIA